VAFGVGLESDECLWSQILTKKSGAFIPRAGFGASDCRNGCPAHLIGFHELSSKEIIECLPGIEQVIEGFPSMMG
jgi:hypothetical protein